MFIETALFVFKCVWTTLTSWNWSLMTLCFLAEALLWSIALKASKRGQIFNISYWPLCSVRVGHRLLIYLTSGNSSWKKAFSWQPGLFWMSVEPPVSWTISTDLQSHKSATIMTKGDKKKNTVNCEQQRGWKYNCEPGVITIAWQLAKRKVIAIPSDTRWGASGFSATAECQSVWKCFMGLYDWQCASCQQLF